MKKSYRKSALLMLVLQLLPHAAFAGKNSCADVKDRKNNNKCYTGINTCCDIGVNPYASSGTLYDKDGYCFSLGQNQQACSSERTLATAYGSAAVLCTTACIANATSWTGIGTAAAAALNTACTASSAAIGVTDMIMQKIINKNSGAYSDTFMRTGISSYGFAPELTSTLLSGAPILYSMWLASKGTDLLMAGTAVQSVGSVIGSPDMAAAGSQIADKGAKMTSFSDWLKKHSSCITAVTDTGMGLLKNSNANKIAANSVTIENSLNAILPPQPIETSAVAAPFTGGANPPSVADLRAASMEVPFDDTGVSVAKMAESFASDGGSMTHNNRSPEAFMKGMQALNDMGISPVQLAESLNANGVAGTMDKITKNDPATKGMIDALRKMDVKDMSPRLAFEGTSGGGGSHKGGDGLGGLFGNRGPSSAAASGSAAAIQFSGVNGDIWHAGSDLSIFEIISKKTKTVSDRVRKY